MHSKSMCITSRALLKYYLLADKIALGRKTDRPSRFDEEWRFQIALRYFEYFSNRKESILNTIFRSVAKLRYMRLARLLGFSVPINVCGPGLALAHQGTVVINAYSQIGENCQIHACVNIGARISTDTNAPQIGNNVYIGPGAKIYGEITIADGIAIGANAVVNKSFFEKGITIAGIPARKIKNTGSKGLIVNATKVISEFRKEQL